jgi:Domain of unknown function (DUF4157)
MHFTAGQSKPTNAPSPHEEASRSFTRAVSSKDPLTTHPLSGQGLLSNQEGLLQRKCACGGTPGVDGLCAECRSKRLGFQGLLDQPEVSRYSPEVDAGQPAPTQSPLPRALVGPRFGHHFANVRIFSKTSANVRPKLTVSEPGDADEQEADRIADGLVSIPAESTAVPLSSSANRGPQVPSELADQIARLQRGGSTLTTQERAHFEPRLGHDFSRVRIHTDSPAAESARMLGAYAYTTGQDIFFAAGHYSPRSPAGRRLLAHELVHVVQQSGEAPTATIQRQPAGAQGQPAGASIHAGQEPQRVDPSVLAQVPPEKWSEVIEYQYRLRGDSERADAVRACRTEGGPACRRILTIREVHELLKLAKNSEGDEGEIQAGLASAAPALAPQPTPTPTPRTPLRLVPPEPTPGVRPGPSPGAVLLTVLAIAGTYAWETLKELGAFQAELRDQGFVILEDPQALCVHGCHLPSRPISPEVPSQPAPQFKLPPWIFERPPQAVQQTPPLEPAPVVEQQPEAAPITMGPTVTPAAPTVREPTTQPTPEIEIGPEPHQRRLPTQTCTNAVLDQLQAQMHSICDTIPGESCSPSKVSPKRLARRPCSEIRLRIAAIRACIRERQNIQDLCFGGRPDPRHIVPIEQLNNGLTACLALEAVNCAAGHPMANL